MKEAAFQNNEIKKRVDFFIFRVIEEFYDFEKDPDALRNLINDPAYSGEINKMRNEMRTWMIKNNDPVLTAFEQRNSKEALQKFMTDDKIRTFDRKNVHSGAPKNTNKIKNKRN